MRKALITLNIVLGGILLWGFSRNMAAQTAANNENKLVRPVPADTISKPESRSKTVKNPLPQIDDAAAKVAQQDIFNNIRSPLANVRNSRTQLTLVGVFHCGKTQGAIIKQNTSQRQFNPYLAQLMMASGMGGNRGGMGGNRGGMGGMGGGRFTRWSQVSGRSSGAEKQYVKLGDTLSNGYTLAEVTRTGVTLIRGNDRIELELQDPSKNRSASRNNTVRRGLNATQQFQQAQMIMQGQMMRTMQQIQRSMPSGGGGNRGGARR